MCLCAPLCLTCFVGKGFQHIKTMCNTAPSYISISFFPPSFYYCGVFASDAIGGTKAVPATAVITESQPRLVSQQTPPSLMDVDLLVVLKWHLFNILVYTHSDKHAVGGAFTVDEGRRN